MWGCLAQSFLDEPKLFCTQLVNVEGAFMTNSVARPESIIGRWPAGCSWVTTAGPWVRLRDPLYILVVIYIFFPYFSNVVVGDPVRGQALVKYGIPSPASSALTVPFLGAIADKTGRLKPWLLTTALVVSACSFALWWVRPDTCNRAGGSIWPPDLMNVAFAYAEVFRNICCRNCTIERV